MTRTLAALIMEERAGRTFDELGRSSGGRVSGTRLHFLCMDEPTPGRLIDIEVLEGVAAALGVERGDVIDAALESGYLIGKGTR